MRKLLISGLILLLVSYSWYRIQLRPVDSGHDALITVEIPKGTAVRRIGDILEEREIIRSSLAFRLRAGARGMEDRLQAGSFVLSPSMHVDDVLDTLTGGRIVQLKVTIPEGFTVKDIDRLIATKGLAATGAILGCAQTCDFSSFEFLLLGKGRAPRGGKIEGYLFPDTYFVAALDFDAKAFLERLLRTFEERVIQKYAVDVAATKRSWHEIVTMASLIEEETRTNDERPTVSGILWKRFDTDQGLAVDATVRYVLEKPTAAITKDDLQIDSPYNLRRYRGLPPGPIANPSLESIRSAIHPEQSPYWYYLHGKTGQIRYAVTNEEHNLNKAKYLY